MRGVRQTIITHLVINCPVPRTLTLIRSDQTRKKVYLLRDICQSRWWVLEQHEASLHKLANKCGKIWKNGERQGKRWHSGDHVLTWTWTKVPGPHPGLPNLRVCVCQAFPLLSSLVASTTDNCLLFVAVVVITCCCVCVCMCVRACVRACVCACVCALCGYNSKHLDHTELSHHQAKHPMFKRSQDLSQGPVKVHEVHSYILGIW